MIGARTRIHHHGQPLGRMRGAVHGAAVDPTTPYGYAAVLAMLTVLADRHLGRPTVAATALLIAGALAGVCAVGVTALGTSAVPRRPLVDTPVWQRLHVVAVGLSAMTGALAVLILPRGHETWFVVGCASGVVFVVAAAVEFTVGMRLGAARSGPRVTAERVLAPGADVADWHARRQASIASLLSLEAVDAVSESPQPVEPAVELPEAEPEQEQVVAFRPEREPEPAVIPDEVVEPEPAPEPVPAFQSAPDPATEDPLDDQGGIAGRGADHATAVVVGTVAVVVVAALVIRRRRRSHRAR
jgi:hypothetical protein